MPKKSSSTSADSRTVRLPSVPNKPPDKLTDYSFLIYGEKGVGKSSLAAQFPDVEAHFMFEMGRRNLRIKQIPDHRRKEDPLTWTRFQQYVSLLLSEKAPGRVVIDTLDLCAKSCQDHWAQKLGVPSLNGLKDFGRSWDLMKGDWQNTFSQLIWKGWRLTFLSHARNRPKNVKALNREETRHLPDSEAELWMPNETQPTATGWATDWSKIPTDFAGYFGYLGHERVLFLRGFETFYTACNTDEHFLQKSRCERAGEPLHIIPMGSSPQEAYRNLQASWNNQLEGYFSGEDSQ
jgi:hypothetical protein